MASGMHFVVMATEDFAPWLSLCFTSIRAFHPEARIWLFDLSTNPSSVLAGMARADGNASVVHYPESRWTWPEWIDRAGLDFFWPNCTVKDRFKMLGRTFRRKFLGQHKDGWIYSEGDFVAKRRRFVRIVAQKPYVLREVASQAEGTIVFIDADAILLGRVDAVLPDQIAVGVTVDEPQYAVIGKDPGCGTGSEVYPYLGVNTGVMFLRGNDPETVRFLDCWAAEMTDVHHVCLEQTALANLLWRLCPETFSSDDQIIQPCFGEVVVPVNLLPCNRFNFFRIRASDKELPGTVSIAHFVGGLKHKQHWEFVRQLALRSIEARRG